MSRHGSEISFRLGPGAATQAREIAARLAGAGPGALRHVLFLAEGPGEYGCLAEWASREEAERYGRLPEVREELARLGALTGRAARVRIYAMEEVGATS